MCICKLNGRKMNLGLLKMLVRGKRDIPVRPFVFKFGLALAISLGGILYTFVRTRRIKPPKSKPSPRSPVNGSQANSRGESGGFWDDDRALPNSICDCSSSGERDVFLLPEFNDLVKECNMDVTIDDISPRKNSESLALDVESPREHKCAEQDEHKKEIKRLQNKVKILEERERKLEIQLLEYYGIKEQETAVIELQNRLRLNNMEAKLYNLKIESLLSDNKRLEVQVADYAHVVNELEAAKAKIKLLRKKLKSEGEQNREQILTLQDRVMKLQEQEKKAVEFDQDMEMQLKEMNELKEELEEVKKSNEGLKLENYDLSQKLEYVQMLAASALDNEEILELKEESHRLKKQNEDLSKEIERLQADRCTDTEELVYLRWINACLRHELRNYQPAPGKTIARDLSKTLSPKSEDKAKQLILEYAHKEDSGKNGMDITGFDSDQCSSSQHSCLTESGERDDPGVDTPLANKTNHSSKTKVFDKLRRLLRGKGSPRHIQVQQKSTLERAVSMDNIAGRYSCDDDTMKTLRNSSGGSSSRRSFDIQRSYRSSITRESSNCSRRTSDDGSYSVVRRIDSLTEDDHDWSPGIQLRQDDQNGKNELLRYSEALRNSRSKSFRRRSASFGSR